MKYQNKLPIDKIRPTHPMSSNEPAIKDKLFNEVLTIFQCEYIRVRNSKRAFNALSSEGKKILIDGGFRITDTEVLKPVTPTPLKKTLYFRKVWALTEQVAKDIPGIENRGFLKDHIDHIISVSYGFKNNIPAEQIAALSNLRMLHYKENMRKGAKVII